MKKELRFDLEVKNLRKKIGDFQILADFSIQEGDRVIFGGRSGVGKSALLRVMAGLSPVDEGKIFLRGREITHLCPQKRNIGFSFQDPTLFNSMNVMENIAFGLKMRGVPSQERKKMAQQWIEQIELTEKAYSSIEELSGGEKQRVSLARAVIWRPNAIFLDEPFSALDHRLRQKMLENLIRFHQSWPVPLLIVTHDFQDYSSFATTRLLLQDDPLSNCRSLVQEI